MQRSHIVGLSDLVRRACARPLVVPLIVLTYVAFALAPFHWQLPFSLNHAERLSGGFWTFPKAGIVRSHEAPGWVARATETQRLGISLQVRAYSVRQSGPARILSVSKDPYLRNLTVAQENSDMVVRLRTPATSLNGTPDHKVADVFRDTQWHDVRLEIEPKRLSIEVDGIERYTAPLPDAPLAVWDPAYRVAIGNELTNDRPWLGEIRKASIRVGNAIDDDLLAHDDLYAPRILWKPIPLRLIPFAHADWFDVFVNFVGFIPLGFFLAFRQRENGARSNLEILSLVALTSLSMELLQVFFPDRYTSTSDLLLNIAGGAVGLLLYRKLTPVFRS